MIEYFTLGLRPASPHEATCVRCTHFEPEPPTDMGTIGKCLLAGRAVWQKRTCDRIVSINQKDTP